MEATKYAKYPGNCAKCQRDYQFQTVYLVPDEVGPRGGKRWQCRSCFAQAAGSYSGSAPQPAQTAIPEVLATYKLATKIVEKELDVSQDGTETKWFIDELQKRVIGQTDAIHAMAQWFRRWRAGMHDDCRPISSLLFLGPTGTGKTKLIEAAAEVLHGSPRKMIKIDCGEFQSDHEIAKLIGSPPGYLGHNETKPRISNDALANNQSTTFPVTFILFDEIEKAGGSLAKILLGILDKATITFGDNKTASLQNCVIVMTSNLGARQLLAMNDAGAPWNEISDVVVGTAKQHFSPEFWNRLDSVVVYKQLTQDVILKIADIEIKKVISRSKTKVRVEDDVISWIASIGYSPTYGARFLRRAIERELLDPITKLIASKQTRDAHEMIIRRTDDATKFYATFTTSA